MLSDAGSIPAGSTTHSHVQWEIRKDAVWLSFAFHAASFVALSDDRLKHYFMRFR